MFVLPSMTVGFAVGVLALLGIGSTVVGGIAATYYARSTIYRVCTEVHTPGYPSH